MNYKIKKKMGSSKRTTIKPIHWDKHFRKFYKREFWSNVRARFRDKKE